MSDRDNGRGLVAVLGALVLALGVGIAGYVVVSGDRGDGVTDAGDAPEHGGDGDESDGDGEARAGAGKRRPAAARRAKLVPTPEGGGPWFTFEGWEDALGAVDWSLVGTSCARLVPALANVGNDAARGDLIPDADWVVISALEAEILAAVDSVSNAKNVPPGWRTFAHPAIAANAAAAALSKRGKGLDVEQAPKLLALAQEHLSEDGTRTLGLDESRESFTTRMISASRQRRRFFAALDDLLTPEQRKALHTDLVRGRARIDLFSAAAIWTEIAHPIHAPLGEVADELLAEMVTMRVFGNMLLERSAENHELVKRVLADMTPQELGADAGWLERWGFFHVEEIEKGARWTEDLVRAAATEMLGRSPPNLDKDWVIMPALFARDVEE